MLKFLAKYQRIVIFTAAFVALSAGIVLALGGGSAWWALAVNALMWSIVAVAMMPYEEAAEEAEAQQPKTTPQVAYIERISVRTGDKIRVLAASEIKYISADGDYVAIFADDGHWLKEQTMKWFEQQLPQSQFLRIHRSTIVNLERIARIERYGTAHHVQLHSGETLSVSNTGYKLLKERLCL